MSTKMPILFSLGYGELGRFYKIEKIREGVVDVLYYPYGFKNIFSVKPRRLRNIPESAVKGPFFPPSKDVGVPAEGIVVLILGENGNDWLAKKIEMDYVGDIKRLEEEKTALKIASESKSERLMRAYKGYEGELKKMKDIQETFVKRPSGPVPPRFREFEEEY